MTKIASMMAKNLLLFIAATLLYAIFTILLSPDPEMGRMGGLGELFRLIFTFEIFNFPRFLASLVLFGGIPPLVTWWISGLLSNKLNFTLLTFVVPAALVITMLLIGFTAFGIPAKSSALEEIMNFFTATGFIFQVGVGFAVAISRLWGRRSQAAIIP